jgi:hypothetical protein
LKKHRLVSRLTYCTNVHPLQDFAVWREKIGFFGPAIGALQKQSPFPLGLWFNEKVLSDVFPGQVDPLIRSFRDWKVSTFTFNAFPYGNFHEPVVKRKVYLPDWTDPARLGYTRRCAELLAALLPEDEAYGSISTLPLGWREEWTEEMSEAAAAALVELAVFLRALRDRTGKTIVLAIEPEPGCVLERTAQVTAWWDTFLRPAARAADAEGVVQEHIGLCYDTCHQAVQFEDAEASLAALTKAGIRIAKMQLSSAIEFPADPGAATRAAREAFVEPKFLHQTRVLTPEGVFELDDLPQALNAGPGLFAHPWRVHNHVPVHADSLLDNPAIGTTRDEMLRAFRYALKHELCTHFEVETYTWSVLPEEHRPKNDEELAAAIAKELDFVREHMEK